MDPNKKNAFIKWLDAVSEQSVKSFTDLQDGSVILGILITCGDILIPVDTPLATTAQRFEAIRVALQGFYHQSLDDKLIDFSVLLQHPVHDDIFVLEMGKLLLALLGCVVQDPNRGQFLKPAMKMEECHQLELKEMIESVLFTNELETQLPQRFAEVLRCRSEASAHVDAGLFFKLVGANASHRTQPMIAIDVTQRCTNEPVLPTIYTNSPLAGKSSGLNIQDISSPLRVMSLSSPMSPLGVIMHSPQLAQRALLHQKIQEIKQLEIVLHKEQHLKSELEFELQEKTASLENSNLRLLELERYVEHQQREMQSMQDKIDDMVTLRTDNEKLSCELSNLKAQLTENFDTQENYQLLEREYRDTLQELQSAREQLQLLDCVKISNEELHAKCQQYEQLIANHTATLEQSHLKDRQRQLSLEEARSMHESCLSHCKILQREKEELEELLAVSNVNQCGGLPVYEGESMDVVTEKKLCDLQAEYDNFRSSWIDPLQHNIVKEKLKLAEVAKERLEQVQTELSVINERLEDRVQNLESELTQAHTELQLAFKNVEEERNASEQLHLKIIQLENEKMVLVSVEQQLSAELKSLQNRIDEDQALLNSLKEDANRQEQMYTESVKQLQSELNNETSLKEDAKRQAQMCKESLEKLQSELNNEYSLKEDAKREAQMYKESVEQIQSELKKENSLKEDAEREAQMYKESVEQLQSELTNEKSLKEDAKREAQMYKESVEQLQSALNNENSLKDDAKREAQVYKESVEQLQSKLISENSLKEDAKRQAQMYKENVEQLQSELTNEKSLKGDAKREAQIYKESVDQLESDVERLESELTNENSLKEDAERQAQIYKESFEQLQSDLINENSLKEDAKRQAQMYKESVERLESELNNEKSLKEDARRQLQMYMESVEQLQSELTNEKSLKEDAKRQSQIYKESVERLESDLTNENSLKEDAKREAQMYKESVERLESDLTNENSLKEDAKSYAQIYKENVEQLQYELSNEKSLKEDARRQLQMCKESVEHLQSELTNEKSLKDDAKRETQMYKESVEQLESDVERLESELTNENSLKDAAKRQAQMYKESVGHLESELNNEKVKKETEIRVLREKICWLEGDNKEFQLGLENEKKTYLQNMRELEIKCEEVKIINQEQLKNLENEYEEFKSLSAQKHDKLTENLSNVSKDKNFLGLELHKIQLEFESAKEISNAKFQKLEAKLSDSECSWKQEIDSLKDVIKESTKIYNTLKQEHQNFICTIQTQKEEILKLNRLIDKINLINAELNDKLEKSKRSVVEYEYKLKSLSEKFNTENQENFILVKSLKEERNSLIQQYNDEKQVLNHKIEQLEQCIAKEKVLYSTMQSSLGDRLSTTKLEYESHIDALREDKETIIKNLQHEEKEKTSLAQTKINSLEEKVMSLEKQINEKECQRLELECSLKERISKGESMSEQIHYYKGVEKSLNLSLINLQADYGAMTNIIRNKEQLKEDLENIISLKDANISKLKEQILSLEKIVKAVKESSDAQKEFAINEITTKYEKELKCLKDHSMADKQQIIEMKSNFDKIKEDLESQLKLCTDYQTQLESQIDQSREHIVVLQEKFRLEAEFSTYKEASETNIASLQDKIAEKECYWRSQYEQLEEEYARGNQEQKEEMSCQLQEMKNKYDGLLKLSADKDVDSASQTQAYLDKIQGLEKAMIESKLEIEGLKERLNKEINYSKSLEAEIASLKNKIAEIEADKKRKIEMLIGQHETQLDEVKNEIICENKVKENNMISDYQGQLTKLCADLEEQRVNYQKVMCDMEEKLGGETSSLRAQLSQMKCQYGTLIESKEKDTEKRVQDCKAKEEVMEKERLMFEQELNKEKEQRIAVQSELVTIMKKLSEYEELILKSNIIQDDLNRKLCASAEKISCLENNLEESSEKITSVGKEVDVCREKITALEKDLETSIEEKNHEKGEREELQRQFEYTQDRINILTAELLSQQQQLAAVEEEKCSILVNLSEVIENHKFSMQEIKLQAERDHSLAEIEKMELEKQLQSTQKCYELVQKSHTELEHDVEKLRHERSQLEEHAHELQQNLYNYLEREKKAAEINGTLIRQLDEKAKEIQEIKNLFNKERELTKEHADEMRARLEKDIKNLREDKTALEIDSAVLKQVQERLKVAEKECQSLGEINEKYKIHYSNKKEIIVQLKEELNTKNQQLEIFKKNEDKLVKKMAPLKEKLETEITKNLNLGNKIRTLEVQNDLADRKIKEYKQQLESENAFYLGDPSDFNKMMVEKESAIDASFMENHPRSIPQSPVSGSHISKGTKSELGFTNIQEETLTPVTCYHRRRHPSKTRSVANSKDNTDTISIGSTTSLALRCHGSAVSLNTIASSGTGNTNVSVPKGIGSDFRCEDEPMEFEWGRLGELSRRNTMCPSHLKTSYPVETQKYIPSKFGEDALRMSTIGNETIMNAELTGSGRKRKQVWETESSSDSAENKTNKHPKTGCVYQKPGPPTPANQRRNSKGSKSPNTCGNSGKGSPQQTPYTLRGTRTPKRSPNATPVPEKCEKRGSAKKLSKRESIAFNLGFSPVSHGRSQRLTRQQGFVQKQSSSSSQTLTRKPLGTRNYLQTGI